MVKKKKKKGYLKILLLVEISIKNEDKRNFIINKKQDRKYLMPAKTPKKKYLFKQKEHHLIGKNESREGKTNKVNGEVVNVFK